MGTKWYPMEAVFGWKCINYSWVRLLKQFRHYKCWSSLSWRGYLHQASY